MLRIQALIYPAAVVCLWKRPSDDRKIDFDLNFEQSMNTYRVIVVYRSVLKRLYHNRAKVSLLRSNLGKVFDRNKKVNTSKLFPS